MPRIESVLSKQQLKDAATGNCYVSAFNMLEEYHLQGKEVKMIHGRPINRSEKFEGLEYGHAWVEFTHSLDGNEMYPLEFCRDENSGDFPKVIYYLLGQINPELNKEYTYQEAIKMMRKHNTYGPWED